MELSSTLIGTVYVGRCTDIEMATQLWSGTHGPAARILVNKIRETIAMKVTTLNAQVLILNLQSAWEVTPTLRSEKENGT